MDSTTLALSGEDGIPSPPEGAFFMVKDGWLHEGRRTDLRRKRMTDRTNKDNLSLSNCLLVIPELQLQIAMSVSPLVPNLPLAMQIHSHLSKVKK